MDIFSLFQGILLGFSISAPVGPTSMLCIRKTVQFGRLSGFFSGLGAAVADVFYAMIAVFGLTLISDLLWRSQFWICLFGGAFLLYLGLKTFFTKAATDPQTDHPPKKTLARDFLSTFFLTLSNPLTVLSFIAIFAALGISRLSQGNLGAISTIIGVFLGSILWWLFLSEAVAFFRKKLSPRIIHRINQTTGLLIAAFGIGAWASLCWIFSHG